MQERRRAQRINLTNITEFEPALRPTDIYAITKDVSNGGACVISQAYLEPGRYIKIRLRKDEKSLAEVKDALVVWAKLIQDNFGPAYQAGLSIPQ